MAEPGEAQGGGGGGGCRTSLLLLGQGSVLTSLAPWILAVVEPTFHLCTQEVGAGVEGFSGVSQGDYNSEFSINHEGDPMCSVFGVCVRALLCFCVGVCTHACTPEHLLFPPSQQSKMEDRLDEAIHVLRSHAVGPASDLHGLLPGHGALTTSFPGPMPLGGRHAGLVSFDLRQGWVAHRDSSHPDTSLSFLGWWRSP